MAGSNRFQAPSLSGETLLVVQAVGADRLSQAIETTDDL
jgi:hypothetical protein